MDTILTILKYIVLIGGVGTILSYPTQFSLHPYGASLITRIIYLLISIYVYNSFGMIPAIILFCFIFSRLDKAGKKQLKKNINNYIDDTLNEGKVISKNSLGNLMIQRENRSFSDESVRKKFVDEVVKYSDEHIKELFDQKSQIHISKVAVSGDEFYLTLKTLEEIQKLTESLRQFVLISPNNLGYRGVSGTELVNICRQLVPGFPFITCQDDNDTLINIDYMAYYECAKCHGVFKNLTNYYGTKYCSNCVQTVQKAERTGESVVLEVTPDQMPSGDMADVFAELEGK